MAEDYPEITLRVLERFPHALDELGQYSNEVIEEASVYGFNLETDISNLLKKAFDHHGSDKGHHGYHLIYGEILSKIGWNKPMNILEIGLGTNNPKLISNMSEHGTPGASLRAFKDVIPNATIFGADIDKDILFSEERIKTAWVDQLNPRSFVSMNHQFYNPTYDLIIDDGLHAISANLNTLLFGLTVLKKGGWIIIEDIPIHARVFWNTVNRLLPSSSFNKYMIKCPGPHVFVLQKK